MEFSTKIKIEDPDFNIQHQGPLFCIGSCFAENIYKKLSDFKFPAMCNPFGTLFHPLAIENALMRIYSQQFYAANEIFHYNDLFFSWDHSTKFSTNKVDDTLEKINQNIEQAHLFTNRAQVFIFTLGTAWAYHLKKGNFFVANCHKIPQTQFDKILLTPTQIIQSLRNIVALCKDINPQANVIFTISPVRHAKDGFRENNLSKGTLHLAINHILNDETPGVYYFPSYEIMLDELRDYRFYDKDMLHPNQLAVEYIWERFADTFFNLKTQELNKEVGKINAAVAHRPINPYAIEHRKFLYDTLKNIDQLTLSFPPDTFKEEIDKIKYQIQHVY